MLKLKDLNKYYSDMHFSVGKRRCFSPWFAANIMPNGDVTFCMDYPDYVLGNIKKESFLNLWNSPKAIDFRSKLKKYKKFPICNRCCQLFKT